MAKKPKETPGEIVSLEDFKTLKNQKQYSFLNTEMLTPSELKFLEIEKDKAVMSMGPYLKKLFNTE